MTRVQYLSQRVYGLREKVEQKDTDKQTEFEYYYIGRCYSMDTNGIF